MTMTDIAAVAYGKDGDNAHPAKVRWYRRITKKQLMALILLAL